MTEHDYYVGYHTAHDQLRERVQHAQHTPAHGRRRRSPGRRAIARRLHSIADRLDG